MSSIKEQVLAQQGQYKESDDKYLSVLKQYNCDLNDEEVAAAVKKILDEKVAENETMEVKKFLFGSIELTSLHTEDTEESILKMIEKVNQFAKDYPQLPHVATVCTYPNFAGLISQSLEVDGVEIAVVSGNFPSSQTFIEVKIAETAMAIKDGATEVDIVMPVGKFFSEDYEGLCDDIQELKETCGEHKMKCILETSEELQQHHEGFYPRNVLRFRLYQDLNRQGEGFCYPRGSIRYVPGYQGILRKDWHSDWFQACRWYQYRS